MMLCAEPAAVREFDTLRYVYLTNGEGGINENSIGNFVAELQAAGWCDASQRET